MGSEMCIRDMYTTFHFPESGANVITTDSSDWATNCPEYKVTAVQVTKVTQPSQGSAGPSQASLTPSGGDRSEAAVWGLSKWQRDYGDFNRHQLEMLERRNESAEALVPAK